MTRSRQRALLTWLARLGVSALILTILFRLVPVTEVLQVARKLPPAVWFTGLCVFLAGHAVAAAKWRLLIGGGVSYSRALYAHLAGLAANLCLPSVAGGDVVRAGLVYRHAHDRSSLAMGSVADRLLDTLGLAILAAAGAWVAFGQADAGGPAPRVLAALAIASAVGAILACFLAARLPPGVVRGDGRIARLLNKLLAAAGELARRPGRLLLALVASMVIQSAFVGVNAAFAAAAGLKVSLAAWFFAWATAKIVAILPVSLGGLGLREASTAALLLPFGADPALVVAVGLLWQTLLYASGLIGLLIQLPGRASAEAKLPAGGASPESLS